MRFFCRCTVAVTLTTVLFVTVSHLSERNKAEVKWQRYVPSHKYHSHKKDSTKLIKQKLNTQEHPKAIKVSGAVLETQRIRQEQLAKACKRNVVLRTRFSRWPYKLNIKNRYLFCPIPKSGWSSWKRLWFYTSGLIPSYKTDVGIQSDLKAGVLDLQGFTAILKAYKHKQYKYAFVFVRNPWERLVSAYINKAVDTNYSRVLHQPCRWESLSPYRPDITFKQFLTCIVDSRSEDMHWKPQWRLCNFCRIKYDYIGHMETIEEDAKEVIKHLGLNVTYPHSFQSTKYKTDDVMFEWYKDLPTSLLKAIQKKFALDFELLGYNKQPPGREDILNDNKMTQ